MTDPLTLLVVAVVLFLVSTKVDSFALAGIAVACFFWSGILYSIA